MINNAIYLTSLENCPSKYSASQSEILNFLAGIHEQSAALTQNLIPVAKLVLRYGVKEKQISRRGFESNDFFLAPEERKICQPSIEHPEGASILQRTHLFSQRAQEVFQFFYKENIKEPEHIIHVTCTGYISPSAAQLLVAERNWSTEVTHAYHMGCYASLPSIRMAFGQAAGRGQTVDVVHTEMCSLHVNPSLHTPEQLVVQTLFADGHIRYQISPVKNGPSLKIISIKEKILPHTENDMGWLPAANGMAMNLSREVPDRIQKNIRQFTIELLNESGISMKKALSEGVFAVHPGGPKIVETIGQTLELREDQIAASRKILFEKGNMSSATLPHIWQQIIQDGPKPGTPIISFAFGPGLTIFGSVFEFQP